MNRFFIYIIFFSCCANFIVAQQNLIYNGSFEEYYSCPIENDLNNGEFEKVKGWWKPTAGTSDYFNRCNSTIVDVPKNFWGYQEAFQGDGYAGLVTSAWANGTTDKAFEYIQTELINPLKSCYEYRFTMYVNLANLSPHSIGKIGALFTKDTLDINTEFGEEVINQNAQVVNSNGNLSDSINWTKIEETFIASGAEKFMTIGYFFPTVQNDTIFIQDTFGGAFGSYYYIDSVSLYELGLNIEECETFEFKIPNIFTPNLDLSNDEINITNLLFLNPEMQIYNRWGNLITELNSTKPVWDGTFENKNCIEGVYYYVLRYETIKGKQTKNGYIQLIR